MSQEFFYFIKNYLFIWLCQVLVEACGISLSLSLSLVAACEFLVEARGI